MTSPGKLSSRFIYYLIEHSSCNIYTTSIYISVLLFSNFHKSRWKRKKVWKIFRGSFFLYRGESDGRSQTAARNWKRFKSSGSSDMPCLPCCKSFALSHIVFRRRFAYTHGMSRFCYRPRKFSVLLNHSKDHVLLCMYIVLNVSGINRPLHFAV